MRNAVRLQCIHQNRLFRECLTGALSQVNGYEVREVDHRKSDRRAQIQTFRPHVVLVDLDLPANLAPELISHISTSFQNTKVILLVPQSEPASKAEGRIVECIAAGTHGYVLEESSLEDLKSAVENVINGQTFCSPQIVQAMFAQLAVLARESRWRTRVDAGTLSRRELEILELIADGLSNKQVARRLCLSLYTVKNHVHNILEKLHVGSRFEAVKHAFDNGWLISPSASA